MKQFIVMCAMIMLGVYIYGLIAGNGEDSLINALERFFRYEINARGAAY